MTPRWRIAVLAGEPSGDRLGAAFVRALRREADAELFGVGGPAMRAAGVESPFPITDLSVMGLFEVLPRAGRILRRMREVVRLLAERRPDAVVTIDSPDFMQRVVRRARRADGHAVRQLRGADRLGLATRPGAGDRPPLRPAADVAAV